MPRIRLLTRREAQGHWGSSNQVLLKPTPLIRSGTGKSLILVGLNNPNFVKEMQGAGSWSGCCFNSPDSCLSSYRSLLPLISGIGMPLSPASYCPALRHVAAHSCHLQVQGRLPGAQKVVRSHSVHSGPSVTGKDTLPQCSQGPCEGQMGLRTVSGLSG